MILLRVVSSTINQRVTEFLRSPTVARQRRQGTKRKDMNDRGTYDGVPTRLKVADVLVNYVKDVSFTRSGLIKSPFRDERTPSFHILAGGYGWVDFWDGKKGRRDRPRHEAGALRQDLRRQAPCRDEERRTSIRAVRTAGPAACLSPGTFIESGVLLIHVRRRPSQVCLRTRDIRRRAAHVLP